MGVCLVELSGRAVISWWVHPRMMWSACGATLRPCGSADRFKESIHSRRRGAPRSREERLEQPFSERSDPAISDRH